MNQLKLAAANLLNQLSAIDEDTIDFTPMQKAVDDLEMAIQAHDLSTRLHSVLRPEVLAFAMLMELRLREKDADKGKSWKEKSYIDLTVNICSAARRIETELFPWKNARSVKALADMANHCMILADVAGALNAAAAEGIDGSAGPGWSALDRVQMP